MGMVKRYLGDMATLMGDARMAGHIKDEPARYAALEAVYQDAEGYALEYVHPGRAKCEFYNAIGPAFMEGVRESINAGKGVVT
ncbi:hypothetical protein [Streptomyces sp. NPDC002644]